MGFPPLLLTVKEMGDLIFLMTYFLFWCVFLQYSSRIKDFSLRDFAMKYFLCRTLRYWFLAFISIFSFSPVNYLSNLGLMYHIFGDISYGRASYPSVTFYM